MTAPTVPVRSSLYFPRVYAQKLVLDFRDGHHLQPFALRRVGHKDGTYLGDPANIRAAAALTALLPPPEPTRFIVGHSEPE